MSRNLNYLTHGIELKFESFPIVKKRVTPNTRLNAFLIAKLLKQGVIVPVAAEPNVSTYRLFAVPKPDKELHPIVDFAPLTTHLASPSFKLPNLHSFLHKNRSYSLATVIDIKDAFLHLPLAPQTADQLRILFQGQEFSCRRLMFGLSPAPIFCQLAYKSILQGFFASINQFVPFLIYLDDIIFLHKTRKEGYLLMLKLAVHLFEMGCPINVKKSILVPQSSVQYLGLKVSFSPLTISVPQDKRAELAAFNELIWDLPIVSKRATARLKGYFMFISQALKLPLSPINVAWPLTISSCISSALAMIRAFPSFNLAPPPREIFVGDSDAAARSIAGHLWSQPGSPN